MENYGAYPRTAQTLIQKLCQSAHTRNPKTTVYEIFPHLKQTPNFHCSSFFRSSQIAEPEYNPKKPLVFSDGRVYKVLEFKIVEGFYSEAIGLDVTCRCCVDVIEKTTSEFVPFEAWFYETRFDGKQVSEADKPKILHDTRQWVWEFLYENRSAVDWSNYGHPYKRAFW